MVSRRPLARRSAPAVPASTVPPSIVVFVLAVAACVASAGVAQTVPEGLERWEDVSLPLVAAAVDVTIDAAGRPYTLSGPWLVHRLDGSTWERVPLRAVPSELPWIEAAPDRPGVVFTHRQNGLLRSDDGGDTWFTAGPRARGAGAIGFDPRDSDRWAVAYTDGHVAVTADDGATWIDRELDASFDVFPSSFSVTIGPGGEIYVLLGPAGCPFSPCSLGAGLYRSADGESWERRSDVAGNRLVATPDGALLAQLEDVGFARSLDDGATWQPLSIVDRVVDVIVLDDETILAATRSDGIFRSIDDGATWTLIAPHPFGFAGLAALAVDPTRPDVLVADGASSASPPILRSTDGGATWQPLVDGLDAVGVQAVGAAPGRVIAASGGSMLLSTDDGTSWTASEIQLFARDLEIAPSDPMRAYVGGQDRESTGRALYRSSDGGVSWQGLTIVDGERTVDEVRDLAISPRDARRLLAASSHAFDSDGLDLSTDGGDTWTRVAEGDVRRVLWDPESPATAYALVGGMLHRSLDDGATWTDLGSRPKLLAAGRDALYAVFESPGPPTFRRSDDRGTTWRILDDPPVSLFEATVLETGNRPGVVCLGLNDGGTLRSVDGGERWLRLVGDPGVHVQDLDVGPDDELWAATFGGGLQRGEFQLPPLALEEGRFVVEVDWRTFDDRVGRGLASLETDDTGTFWFFGRENLELMIKVLDGRAVNSHWWVYYGALSNVELTITVTDTWNGRSQVYFNPLGSFASQGDVTAFASQSIPALGGSGGNLPPVVGERELALGDRFRATVTWRDFEGVEGDGIAVPLTRRLAGGAPGETGAFWFFDPRNLELMVKVLDGRAVNGKFWVFYGSLTNVEFTLRIEDMLTGAVYESFNPLGTFASVGDVDAFEGDGGTP